MLKKHSKTGVFLCFGLFLCCTLSGCGKSKVPDLVRAEGIVLFNEQPIEGVSLTFAPVDFQDGNRVAVAKTDAQGRFELSTLGEKGALPNKYAVALVKNEIVSPSQTNVQETPSRPEPRKIRSVIPVRYNKPDTSEIVVEIEKSGNKAIRIELSE